MSFPFDDLPDAAQRNVVAAIYASLFLGLLVGFVLGLAVASFAW